MWGLGLRSLRIIGVKRQNEMGRKLGLAEFRVEQRMQGLVDRRRSRGARMGIAWWLDKEVAALSLKLNKKEGKTMKIGILRDWHITNSETARRCLHFR